MQQTVFTILTDPSARHLAAVQESITQEYTAGAPWFD